MKTRTRPAGQRKIKCGRGRKVHKHILTVIVCVFVSQFHFLPLFVHVCFSAAIFGIYLFAFLSVSPIFLGIAESTIFWKNKKKKQDLVGIEKQDCVWSQLSSASTFPRFVCGAQHECWMRSADWQCLECSIVIIIIFIMIVITLVTLKSVYWKVSENLVLCQLTWTTFVPGAMFSLMVTLYSSLSNTGRLSFMSTRFTTTLGWPSLNPHCHHHLNNTTTTSVVASFMTAQQKSQTSKEGRSPPWPLQIVEHHQPPQQQPAQITFPNQTFSWKS